MLTGRIGVSEMNGQCKFRVDVSRSFYCAFILRQANLEIKIHRVLTGN